MMHESKHMNQLNFDRLEEGEDAILTRTSVLRSISHPMARPWSKRGAIALLILCGITFGAIAIATFQGSSNETSNANAAEADSESIATFGGSESYEAGTVEEETSMSHSKYDDNFVNSGSQSYQDDTSASANGILTTSSFDDFRFQGSSNDASDSNSLWTDKDGSSLASDAQETMRH
ncbi:hypothetical protein Plhal304r1_c003g0011451 [Plasmopara halstedii]